MTRIETHPARRRVGLVLLLALLAAGSGGSVRATPVKLPVHRLEVGYALDTGRMTARVTLAAAHGEAIDFEVRPEAIPVVLHFAELKSRGVSLYAEVEDRKVRALVLSAP